MCLMLYMGTSEPLAEFESEDLSIESLPAASVAVARHFAYPNVYFVGAHTGCSCGFPSVMTDHPVPYFEGMFDDEDEETRLKNLESVRALLASLRSILANGSPVELLAVWIGDEAEEPHGTIEVNIGDLEVGTFFFNERYLYRIQQ